MPSALAHSRSVSGESSTPPAPPPAAPLPPPSAAPPAEGGGLPAEGALGGAAPPADAPLLPPPKLPALGVTPFSRDSRLAWHSPHTLSMHACTLSTLSWPGSTGYASRRSSASQNATPRVPRRITASTRRSPSSFSLVNTRSTWRCSVRPPASQSMTSLMRAMASPGPAPPAPSLSWFHRERAMRNTPPSSARSMHIASSHDRSLSATPANCASRSSGMRCSPRWDRRVSSAAGGSRTSVMSASTPSCGCGARDTQPAPTSSTRGSLSTAAPTWMAAVAPARPPVGRMLHHVYGSRAARDCSTASGPMCVVRNDSEPDARSSATSLTPAVLQELVSGSHHPTRGGGPPSSTPSSTTSWRKGPAKPSGGGSSSDFQTAGSAPAGGMG
mmetsp:Transcript_5166/g.12731  ORF Transcript_5166/g.12731 Transcript_5166/m.12731 type:complete len:386 (+) Transcript_5166:308-1465(+)